MMFWGKLTLAERDEFILLLRKTSLWISWVSTKPTLRGPEPPIPSNEEWIRHDVLSTQGWSN